MTITHPTYRPARPAGPTRIVGDAPFLLDAPIVGAQFAIAPDASVLYSLFSHELSLWNASTGRLLGRFPHNSWSVTFTLSADGTLLAMSLERGWVHLLSTERLRSMANTCAWDEYNSGTLQDAVVRSWQSHPNALSAWAFSPDGTLLAVGGGDHSSASQKTIDRSVRVWECATGTLRKELKGSRRNLSSVAFSPDGKHLACAGDKVVRVFELVKGKKICELGESETQCFLTWSSNTELWTLSAASTPSLRCWEIPQGTLRTSFGEEHKTVSGLSLYDTNALIVGGEENFTPIIAVYDRASGTRTATWKNKRSYRAPDFAAHTTSVWAVDTGIVERLDGLSLTPRYNAPAQGTHPQHFAFEENLRGVAVVDSSQRIAYWSFDATAPREIVHFEEHTPRYQRPTVTALALSSRAEMIAAGTADNALFVQWIESGAQRLRVTNVHEKGNPGKLAFTPDNEMLLSWPNTQAQERPILALGVKSGIVRWKAPLKFEVLRQFSFPSHSALLAIAYRRWKIDLTKGATHEETTTPLSNDWNERTPHTGISPDGTKEVLLFAKGIIEVHELPERKVRWSLPVETLRTAGITADLTDGRTTESIAIGNNGDRIALLLKSHGELLVAERNGTCRLLRSPHRIQTVRIANDDTRIVCLGWNSTLLEWQLE